MNKKLLLFIIGFLLVVSLIVGTSYAYWMMSHTQTNENIVNTGCFSTSFTEVEDSAINLTSAFPMTDEDGMKIKPYEFTITNTCDTYAIYNINLEVLNTTTLSHDLIKVVLGNNTPKIVTKFNSSNSTINDAHSYELFAGGLASGKSSSFEFRMWIDELGTVDNAQNKVIKAKISVVSSSGSLPAYAYIENLLNYNDTELNNSDFDNNVRYVGSNPDNYVNFNDELWRIIGVFDTKDSESYESKKRIKLVRSESIGNYSWDSSSGDVNSGFGVNEWSQADIMNTLNYGAYWQKNIGECYNDVSNSLVTCDFSVLGLKSESIKFVDDVIWNNGTIDGLTHTYDNTLVNDFYDYEKSEFTGKICSEGNTCNDSVKRETVWEGYVGLLYPSDVGYAIDPVLNNVCLEKPLYTWGSYSECLNNNWIFNLALSNWLMTPVPLPSRSATVFVIREGIGFTTTKASTANGILPVVYLKENVTIASGQGTKSNPYELMI